MFIPRLNFDLPLPNSHLRVTRKQFPLRLAYCLTGNAYCLTGNKSQGKTLQCVGADLRDDVFSHGQAYVIASRVPAAHQLGVLVHPDRIVRRGDGATLALMTNVMFPELLRGRCPRGATGTTSRAARAAGVASRHSAPSS